MEIGHQGISFGFEGFLARKPKFVPVEHIKEVALGIYNDGSDHESMITLNIKIKREYSAMRNRRVIIGYWLHPELKQEIFQQMSDFITKNNIPIMITQYKN